MHITRTVHFTDQELIDAVNQFGNNMMEEGYDVNIDNIDYAKLRVAVKSDYEDGCPIDYDLIECLQDMHDGRGLDDFGIIVSESGR